MHDKALRPGNDVRGAGDVVAANSHTPIVFPPTISERIERARLGYLAWVAQNQCKPDTLT